MLEVSDTGIAHSTKKGANPSCVVAMVNREMFSRCGVVGAADGALAILRLKHPLIFSFCQTVMLLSFIFGIAVWVCPIAAFLVFIAFFQIGAPPFIVVLVSTRFAHMVNAAIMSLRSVKISGWLDLFAENAALRAFGCWVCGWPQIVGVDHRSTTGFAFPLGSTVRLVKVCDWLGLPALVACFRFHRLPSFGMSKV